jgi:hypothetical protein
MRIHWGLYPLDPQAVSPWWCHGFFCVLDQRLGPHSALLRILRPLKGQLRDP